MTIDFLIQYFQQLFSYEYTKTMEELLDAVSSGKNTEWSTICKTCYEEIKKLSVPVKNIVKQTYQMEDGYEFIFEKYGPSIKHTLEDGTIEYLKVRKDIEIDLEKIKRNEYSLDELMEMQNTCLGKYEGGDIYLKNGRYGPYVEWPKNEHNELNRESVKTIKKPFDEITILDVEEYLKNRPDKSDKLALRTLNNTMSVRNGLYSIRISSNGNALTKRLIVNN